MEEEEEEEGERRAPSLLFLSLSLSLSLSPSHLLLLGMHGVEMPKEGLLLLFEERKRKGRFFTDKFLEEKRTSAAIPTLLLCAHIKKTSAAFITREDCIVAKVAWSSSARSFTSSMLPRRQFWLICNSMSTPTETNGSQGVFVSREMTGWLVEWKTGLGRNDQRTAWCRNKLVHNFTIIKKCLA